jgi:hypothetical protein
MHVGLGARYALEGREATDVIWVRMCQRQRDERSFA